MVSLQAVNRRIKKYGYKLVTGEGYWYFSPLQADIMEFNDSSVFVFRLSQLTVDQWERELLDKISSNLDLGRVVKNKPKKLILKLKELNRVIGMAEEY